MVETPPLRLGVLVLGAGASSRMGQPKLVLPWGGSTILGHIIQQWRSLATGQLAVVCAPSPNPVHAELDRLAFPSSARILNPTPADGMFSSIQCAARWPAWNPQLTHFAILLGDQPQISTKTLEALIGHASVHPDNICQPAFNGRPKHPVILPKRIFEQLSCTAHSTLRDFLQNSHTPRSILESSDPSLELDLDTPADYSFALDKFQSSPQ